MYYMKVSKLNQHFVNVICSGVEWKEINEEKYHEMSSNFLHKY